MAVNIVILSGRLTRDPDVRNLENSDAVTIARFTLAVDRPVPKGDSQNERTADFPQITVFGKTAENVAKYLMKGSLVNVQARVQTGSYMSKSGNEIYTTDIVANRVDFLAGYKTKTQNSNSEYNPLFDGPKKQPEGQGGQTELSPSAPPNPNQSSAAAPNAQNTEKRDYKNQESVAAPSSGEIPQSAPLKTGTSDMNPKASSESVSHDEPPAESAPGPVSSGETGGTPAENSGDTAEETQDPSYNETSKETYPTDTESFAGPGSQPAPFYDSVSEFEEVSDDDEW